MSFLQIIEVIIGIILFNISLKSIKKSIIRGWREGFAITLISSIFLLFHGLTLNFLPLPSEINNIFLTILILAFTFAFFRISAMKGLKA